MSEYDEIIVLTDENGSAFFNRVRELRLTDVVLEKPADLEVLAKSIRPSGSGNE